MKNILKTIGEKLIAMADAANPVPAPVPTGATSGTTAPVMVVTQIQPKEIQVAYSAVGAPVTITGADGQSVIAEDGQYPLVNGKVITIAQGKLSGIGDVIASGATSGATGNPNAPEKGKVPPQFAKMEIEMDEETTKAVDELIAAYELRLAEAEKEASDSVDKLIAGYEMRLANDKAKYEKLIEALKTGGNTIVQSPVLENKHLSKAEIIKLSLAEKRKNNIY
jgi:hypothetical protein